MTADDHANLQTHSINAYNTGLELIKNYVNLRQEVLGLNEFPVRLTTQPVQLIYHENSMDYSRFEDFFGNYYGNSWYDYHRYAPLHFGDLDKPIGGTGEHRYMSEDIISKYAVPLELEQHVQKQEQGPLRNSSPESTRISGKLQCSIP